MAVTMPSAEPKSAWDVAIARREQMKARAKALPTWTPQPGPQRRFIESEAREILYGGAAGGGKRIRVDEPIPTPMGWTTMGQLKPGDIVLDADGKPTAVTWCSEIEEHPDAWELIFDDGTKIECDADHQWVTLTDKDRVAQLRLDPEWRAARRAKRPRRIGGKKSALFTATIAARNAVCAAPRVEPPPRRGYTRTTAEIVATLRIGKSKRSNHCILNADPIDLPSADIAVDPYVLGAWLGDGSTGRGVLTGLDPEIWRAVEAAGHVVRHSPKKAQAHYVRGLVTHLRTIGVLHSKHIPQQYLRGSTEQRLALLQGLCDTDGHATEKGSIEFTTTSRALRDGMMELLASLGIKPSCREGRATLRGRDISAKWRIQFWTALPCFRVVRKLVRQQRDGFRGCHDRRYIVDARRVTPTPMRCIAVDSPSRTYLAGRAMVPTHNTAALAALPLPWARRRELLCLYLRRTTDELQDLKRKAEEIYERGKADVFAPFCPEAKFREDKGTWVFHWGAEQGATAIFGHCDDKRDWKRYVGQEYQIICFDELTWFTEEQYDEICKRLRSSAKGLPRMIRATSNPGGPGHCVPYGDVLTPEGWRDIREMRVGDPVYSVRPTGELYETRVAQVHQVDFDGDLVDVDARGLRMVCTPDHKVAKVGGRRAGLHTRGGATDLFSLVPFNELPGQATILRSVRWHGADLSEFRLPAVRAKNQSHLQPVTLPGRAFCELLGWYLSEGSFIYEPEKKWFSIAQKKSAGRERIKSMLDRNGFKYHDGPSGFTVHSVPWAAYFSQFGKSRDKFIPHWVKAGSLGDLAVLLGAMMAGDGHWSKVGESGTYYTISKRLADDVAEVALKLGYLVYQVSRQREERDGLSHEVYIKRAVSGGTEILTGQHTYNVNTQTKRRSDIKSSRYTGSVYCLGIEETHSFIIRQHGSVWVSGNCWVFRRWEPWLDPNIKMPDEEIEWFDAGGARRVAVIRGLPPREENGRRVPPAVSGQILYVARIGEREVFSTEPFEYNGAAALTRTFIGAKLSDNPALLKEDPNYRATLRQGSELRRRQLEEGDWLSRPAAGMFFKREWFEIVEKLPEKCEWAWCRAWDKAATEPGPKNQNPDWTRGVKVGKCSDGYYYVTDVESLRGAPGAVSKLMRDTADADGKEVRIRIPQDPAAAGVQAAVADVALLDGFIVTAKRVSGAKAMRASPAASQAHPQATGGAHGRFRLLKGPWNEALLVELESFDGDENNGEHDDQVDALSDAYDELKDVDIDEDYSFARAGRRRW